MGGRRSLAICIAALATALAAPSFANAESGGAAIASLTAETPVSAGSGWVVWSTRGTSGWGLEAYHAGAVSMLHVAPRPQPFDASVGSDAHGDPVVTFSRCARTPEVQTPEGRSAVVGGSLAIPGTGRGCRIELLALPGGHERALPIPSAAGASDTSPSMWHGHLAFARKTRAHGDVWQIMSWSTGTPHRLQTLRHGAIPMVCEGGCSVGPAHGEVQALDRDASLVTFMWRVEGPGVLGEGAWEIRVDNLASGHSSRADGGFGHEACTSPTGPTELEYLKPVSPPIASGNEVLFPQLETFGCFVSFASRLDAYTPGAKVARYGSIPTALALAADGSTLYALLPQEPLVEAEDSPQCSVKAPCSLERIAQPHYTKTAPVFQPFR
jgi:hypothetical protein